MTRLTEEHIPYLYQYKDLLDTINEGLDYILASYSDYSKTEGDVILSDIFAAFTRVIQVNEDLKVLYKDDAIMLSVIQGFEKVIIASEEMDSLFDKFHEKQELVQQKLYPAYKIWLEEMLPLVNLKIQQ